jgi:drug/metabolite transporter (DMT)-like permease
VAVLRHRPVRAGISQILFTRSVGVIGPSRTAIVVGISPVLSAGIAVTLLGEPLHVALVFGTLARRRRRHVARS